MGRRTSVRVLTVSIILSALGATAEAQCPGEWLQLFPSAHPSARSYHAMAYDSIRHVAVLFGGLTGLTLNAETLEWDGVNWTQKVVAQAPSARFGHAMAFDTDRG